MFAFEDNLDHYETIMLKFIAAVCLTASTLFSATGFAAEPLNHADVLAPFVDQDSFGVVYADIASLDLPKDEKAILPPQLLLVMQSLPAEVQAQMFLVGGAETLAVSAVPITLATVVPCPTERASQWYEFSSSRG